MLISHSKQDIFKSEYYSIYSFGDKFFKIIFHKTATRQSGWEDFDGNICIDNQDEFSENDEKLSCNISRARSTIFELAMCNDWDWFFTGTLDSSKIDRANLDEFRLRWTNNFIPNFNRHHNLKIKYLLVPELHSDLENWHIHGLLKGLPVEYLDEFKIGMNMSSYIAEKVYSGSKVYSWSAYAQNFGFCDLEYIGNHEAVSKYLTKYIVKSFENGRAVSELSKHMYYCSRGLNRKIAIKKGSCSSPLEQLPWSFENDYIKSFSTSDRSLIYHLLTSISDD